MTIEQKKSFRESLKNIKPQDFIYGGIMVLFITIITILFFFSTRFISKNLNRIFYTEENVTTEALNQSAYKITAQKLGLSTNTPIASVNPILAASVPTATTTNTLDKSKLSIMIKNSTGEKGVATLLAKAFEDAGFNKAKTANEPDTYPITTLYLRNSKKEYQTILLETLQKSYPGAVATTTEPKSADAVIVIGEK